MRYRQKFVNHYLSLSFDTNSREIHRLIKNVLDFDDKPLRMNPRLKTYFILDDVGFENKPRQKEYMYSKKRPCDNTLLQSYGEEIIRTEADRKKCLVRGSIFGYRAEIKEHIFYHIMMKPFQFLMSQHGYFFVHCSVVSKGKDCALITGSQNAGKSTLSVVLARKDFNLLTDDDCFVKLIKDEVQLFPFGTKIGLSDNILKKYRDLGRKIEKDYQYGNKQRISLKHISKYSYIDGFRCKIILLPKYKANCKKISVKKVSGNEVIKMIANEFTVGRNCPEKELQAKFLTFYALTKKAPAFELIYNDEKLDELPGVVKKLMAAM